MATPTLQGRRIHISGCISGDPAIASAEEVALTRDFIKHLVIDLMKRGATFVVPIDAEKYREGDGLPICFDWLVLETIVANILQRPPNAINPLVTAVEHHKTESQMSLEKATVWDAIRDSEHVAIHNASQWDMFSKRMEIQAEHGDVLITIGGSEGVLFLANLYHGVSKPVIPLDFKICGEGKGSRKLFAQAATGNHAQKFFSVVGASTSRDLFNKLNFAPRHEVATRVNAVTKLLEALERPTAFAVRLLNPSIPGFKEVDDFFTAVVKHVVEQDLGYTLKVVDGKQLMEHARVDAEIFEKLHRATVVVADLTAERPNCFLELGYALGRSIPTILTAMSGTKFPFDVTTISGHIWNPTDSVEENRRKFREYWTANIQKAPLVKIEALVP